MTRRVLRDAAEADLPAILAIHNDAIVNSLAIWQHEPVDLANRRAWFAERRAKGYPVMVADESMGVAGFASYGDFRSGAGYGGTVEHSLYLRWDRRGQGLGRALMDVLIKRARGQRKHVMVAAIGLPNEASVALHARCGFVAMGTLREIGRKSDRWLDLLLMQKML